MKISNPTELQVYTLSGLFISPDVDDIISIDDDDLGNFFKNFKNISLFGVDGEDLHQAVEKLKFDDESLSYKQVILKVVTNQAYPMSMSELSVVNDLVRRFSDDCVVIWGYGKLAKQDVNVRIVMLCGS